MLIIGSVWPEPNSSAAGGRMLQLIQLFKEQDWTITFASAAQDSDFMSDLADLGIQKQKIRLNDDSFNVFVAQLNPAIVLFDRFITEEQFGWRIIENCPDALRILDTEDLHCLRLARQTALKANRALKTVDLFSDVAMREIASIWRCDLSLIISEFEMTLLQNVFKVDAGLLYYLPFLLNPITEQISEQWPDFNEREGFIFVGNFWHEPNWDAVRYLKMEIWPKIRQILPEANLKVYGAYAGQKVQQMHDPKNGFLVLGRAKEAHEVVRKARILLAPLRFGAGIKGKLSEAMWCGTPSITTSVGAEAMDKNGLWNGIIADDPEIFAKAASDLYSQQELWLKSQRNGIEIFNFRYLKSNHTEPFIAKINRTVKNLQHHREGNFTGAMLNHHARASTKYLSKWITEKNKT